MEPPGYDRKGGSGRQDSTAQRPTRKLVSVFYEGLTVKVESKWNG